MTEHAEDWNDPRRGITLDIYCDHPATGDAGRLRPSNGWELLGTGSSNLDDPVTCSFLTGRPMMPRSAAGTPRQVASASGRGSRWTARLRPCWLRPGDALKVDRVPATERHWLPMIS